MTLITAPAIALHKRRLTRLSRHLMQAKRADDCSVLREKIAFAHLAIGTLLSYAPGGGHQSDPLWKHLQEAAGCYEQIRIGNDESKYHRRRSIFYQRSARVTMRMAARHKDRALRDIAEQRILIAERSARLSGSPKQQDNVRALQYHLRQIDMRPVTVQIRFA
jgi:hypothetical protein